MKGLRPELALTENGRLSEAGVPLLGNVAPPLTLDEGSALMEDRFSQDFEFPVVWGLWGGEEGRLSNASDDLISINSECCVSK